MKGVGHGTGGTCAWPNNKVSSLQFQEVPVVGGSLKAKPFDIVKSGF